MSVLGAVDVYFLMDRKNTMWIVGLTVDCCINPPASFDTELEAQAWVLENNIRWDQYYIWQE